MNGHSVHRRTHAELTHPEEDIATLGVEMEIPAVLQNRLGRGGQVGCAPDQFRHGFRNRIHDLATRAAGRDRLGILFKYGEALFPATRQLSGLRALELSSLIRKLFLVRSKKIVPLLLVLLAL